MLPWWGWVLLWTLLVVGGGVWVGIRARSTWRSATALTAEVDRAGRLLAEAVADTSGPQEDIVPTPALAQDPREVREQYRRHRAEAAERRRVRRAARTPPWARVD
jgi:hypothetical protein